MPLDKVKISNCAIALVAKVLTLAATGQPLAASVSLKRFRNYSGLIKVARSGFPWEKTT
jgi:hypothetical protein